ncbi:MAG: MEDS domain-containing protein [Halosimplex sp.]
MSDSSHGDSNDPRSDVSSRTGEFDERPPRDDEPGPENHRALVYESRDEQLAAVVPFVRQALAENERVMYVTHENSADELVSVFEGAGIDVDGARESGALTFHSPSDTYRSSGAFDAEEMIDYLDERGRAIVEGDDYDRLHITAEMSWVLEDETDALECLVEYERRLNEFYPENPVVGLCQYNRTRFPPELLHDIIRAHPHQVYNATVTQNFAYLPPDRFFEANPAPDVEAFIETHLDRVRARGELEERRETLSALADAGRDLLTGDAEEVVERTVATIDHALSPSIACAFVYDGEADSFDPEAVRLAAGSDAETVALPDEYREVVREAFVSGETQVFSNFQAERELPALNTVLQSGVAFPIDRHGVLFVGSTRAGAFDPTDVEFVETVALSARNALERVDHERTLERQNEQLRHLNRINETIRRIDRALVQASGRDEIEAVVCERLAETDAYEFVWIGDRDPLTDQFVPREWAGDGEAYLDELYRDGGTTASGSAAESETGGEPEPVPNPAREALETQAAYAVENVLTTAEFDAWRRAALSAGFHSSLSVPLVYNETEYGVLNVYTGEPNLMSEMEQEVLQELGATVAYAIDGAETRESLHTDKITRVDMRVAGPQSRLVGFAARSGTAFDVESVLPATDDGLRLFFSVDESAAEGVLAAGRAMPSVETVRQITDDRGGLFEAVVAVDSSVPTVMERFDGTVSELTVTPDGVEFTAELPQRADVSDFVAAFDDIFADTEVRSVTRAERPLQTRQSFFREIEDRLTEKQMEALEVAYHSGYFEWPRDSSARDVAESLGVTQPTFNGHLRAGERKLFSSLFDT